MNLQPVNRNPVFRYQCIGCHALFNSGERSVFADLEGVPYRDYYCGQCAAILRRVDQSGEMCYAPQS